MERSALQKAPGGARPVPEPAAPGRGRSRFRALPRIVPGLLLLLPSLAGAEIKIIHENGKYGVADTAEGRLLVRPIYEYLLKVTDDFFIAKREKMFGAIDASGATVVGFHYTRLDPVRQRFVSPPEFHLIATIVSVKTRNKTVRDGVAPRYKLDRKYAKSFPGEDPPYKVEYEPVYRSVNSETRDTLVGVITMRGEEVIPLEYREIRGTEVHGVYIVGEEYNVGDGKPRNRKYGIAGAGGEILLPVEYDRIEKTRAGPDNTLVVAATRNYKEEEVVVRLRGEQPAGGKIEVFRKDGFYGFRGGDGKELAPPSFEDAREFRNGFARIKKDGKWGFLGEDGRVAIEPRYDYVWDFESGVAKVRLEDGAIRHVDPKGKLLAE